MAGVVALFALGIGAYGALSLAQPQDEDDEDAMGVLDDKQRNAQTIGSVRIDQLDDLGGNEPALPTSLEDFWPVLRGDLHRVNFSAGKQRKGYVSSRWHAQLPTTNTQARRDVGMLPPDLDVSTSFADEQRKRVAFAMVEGLPWMMQPTAFDKRLKGPVAYRYLRGTDVSTE